MSPYPSLQSVVISLDVLGAAVVIVAVVGAVVVVVVVVVVDELLKLSFKKRNFIFWTFHVRTEFI